MDTLSVIIPVYNAEKFLHTLFKCLDKNELNQGDEILLIDNGSSDSSKSICLNQVEKNPDIYKYYFFAEKAGSYSTRNYALEIAKGDILVFTDSDCMPDANWLSSIRNNIKQGIVLAGEIEIEIAHNGLWENFDAIAHLNSEKNAANNCVATANMAVYKKDFFEVGKFEERFSGGDYEWSQRARKKGKKIQYNPQIHIFHPSRKTFKQILQKEQRIAYGAGMHHKLHSGREISLIIKYFLKFFKIDTNFRYSLELKKRGFKSKELFKFNICFCKIRREQLKFARAGFRREDVRKLAIK